MYQHAGGATAAGSLAATGFNTLSLAVAAFTLVLIGVSLLKAGRRVRSH